MNFRRAGKGEGGDPDLNLTPLIDVVFLLLIFFLITTTFVTNPNIRVDLPKASSQEVVRDKQELQVAVSKEGDIFVNSVKVDVKKLSSFFQKAAGEDNQTLVIIQADRKVRHGIVVEVMDAAQRAGLTRLGIAVESGK